MNLSHFEAFRAIMQTGTVSGAAEILGRSQPAVSRMMDRLEYEIGLTLFVRRKGRVSPTAAAHHLLDEVERAFVSLSSLQDFARRLQEGDESEVACSVMPALGIDFMPQVISRFLASHPRTRVTLNVRMSVNVEDWAATQQVDFGLAETPFKRSGFRTEPFSEAPYVAAVHADHPLAKRGEVRARDLAEFPLLSWSPFATVNRMLEEVMQSAGVRPRPICTTTFSSSICGMVRRGLGVGIVDPFTAAAQKGNGLCVLPFVPDIPCRVALLLPDTRSPTPLASALITYAEEERDLLLRGLFDKA